MALAKCRECGHDVAATAKTCPKCGVDKPAPRKSSTGTILIIAAAVVGVFIWLAGEDSTTPSGAMATADTRVGQTVSRYVHATLNVREGPGTGHPVVRQLQPGERVEVRSTEGDWSQIGPSEWAATDFLHQTRPPSAAELFNRGERWHYTESEDEMSGETIRSALRLSKNTVEFGAPYRGAQRATLRLRDHPRFGRSAMISVERGQFLCRIRDCNVRVRFGDESAETWAASEPQSLSTTLLFITPYDAFRDRVSQTDRVFIEAAFFREGNRVFEFDVAGMEWP